VGLLAKIVGCGPGKLSRQIQRDWRRSRSVSSLSRIAATTTPTIVFQFRPLADIVGFGRGR